MTSETLDTPTPPAVLQHQLVKVRQLMRFIARDTDGITVEQTVSVMANTWSHEIVMTMEPSEGDPAGAGSETTQFKMVMEYTRRGQRWRRGQMRTFVDGVKDNEVDESIEDAIARLLSDRGRVNAGDRTTPLGGDTSGTRSNSVEVRRNSVIRN